MSPPEQQPKSKPKSKPEPRRWFNGRLNLEQQKKRAKELLRAVQADDPAGRARLASFHPEAAGVTARTAKLADAQFVIARENGFASWPRMKAHIEKLRLAQQAIDLGKPILPDTGDTCHIRCGSDIAHGLKLAGFAGRFIEFSDPYVQGPLCDVPLPEFIDLRTEFITHAYGVQGGEAAKLRDQYRQIGALENYAHIVLWFEHDSYDQLILAFLLAHLRAHPVAGRLELICVDQVPGVPHFQGLGQLSPELLLWLWENARRPITTAQLDMGHAIWSGLLSRDRSVLSELAGLGSQHLPHAARALSRHLQELPSAANDLGLTQQLTLEILRDGGCMPAGRVYRALMTEREPLPFLGDLMFHHMLMDLNNCRMPLFSVSPQTRDSAWPEQMLDITAEGLAILTGEKRYLPGYLGERWVGNIRLSAADKVPHWRLENGRVIIV